MNYCRNLRIQEYTVKYLWNLDPNSAYYDPKTGAMKENPYVNAGKNPDEVIYAGDNFIRYTGDTISMAHTQLFAWEAYDKGCEVHLQADPTKLELLYESFKVKKEDFKEQQKESILEKVIMTKRHTIRFNPSGLGAIGIQYQYNYISELLQQNKPPQNLIV